MVMQTNKQIRPKFKNQYLGGPLTDFEYIFLH